MSLECLLEGFNLLDEIGTQDKISLAEAESILEEVPILLNIDKDNTERQWFDRNIKAQKNLINLQGRVSSLITNLSLKLREVKGSEMNSGEYEFIRSADERESTMYYNCQEYRDLKTSIEKLTALGGYVENLLRALKSSMRLFRN